MNTVLVFCVASYFLQCQGAGYGMTPGEREIIRDVVMKYEKQNGIYKTEDGAVTITLKGVKDCIGELKEGLKKQMTLFDFDHLKEIILSSYSFKLEEIIKYIEVALQQDPLEAITSTMLRDLFEAYESPNGINFEKLNQLIIDSKLFDEFPHYLNRPKTSIPYKIKRSEYNNFTRDEVEYIIINFYFPDHIF